MITKGDVDMEILKETFFIQGLASALVIALLVKLIVFRSYHRLLSAANDMDKPKRHWIGILKKKFENYYQLNAKIHNASCIVDQYFENHRIFGIPVSVWEQIPGFCGILCMLLGCLGAIRGMIEGIDFFLWFRSLMISVSVGFLIFMIDNLFLLDHLKKRIRSALINYLENILPNRVNKAEGKWEKEEKQHIRQEKRSAQEKEEADEIVEKWSQIASTRELELTKEDIETLKDFINDL